MPQQDSLNKMNGSTSQHEFLPFVRRFATVYQRREYGRLFISQPAKLHQTRPVDLNRCRCCRFYCRVVRLIDKSGSRLCEDSRRFFAILRTGHG